MSPLPNPASWAKRWTPDVAALLGVWSLALVQRLWMAPHAGVHEDSFAPFLVAAEILWHGTLLPRPWHPESGYGLYYTVLPSFLGADSVIDLFRHSFALAALVSPLAYVGLRWGPAASGARDSIHGEALAAAEARCAGLIAALWLAFSPELCDTLLHGARTYHASVWTAVITCGALLALARRAVGVWLVLLGLPMAMMNHPYAAAFLLPTAVLLPRLVSAAGWRGFILALVGGVALSFPRLVDLWATGTAPSGELAHGLEEVARSNQSTPITLSVVLRNLRVAFPVSFSLPGIIHGWILLAPLTLLVPTPGPRAFNEWGGSRSSVRFALFTALGFASFTAIAVVIFHLDSYHFRVLLPVAVTAGAWALVRAARWLPLVGGLNPRWTVVALPMVGVLLGLAYAQPGYFAPERRQLPGYPSAASTAHAVAEGIQADRGDHPRRIGGINVGHADRFFAHAVPIDMVLAGTDADLFPLDNRTAAQASLYVVICIPRAEFELVEPMLTAPVGGSTVLVDPDAPQGPAQRPVHLFVLRFDDLGAARAWTAGFCEAIPVQSPVNIWWDTDYLPFVAGEVRLDRSVAWWDGCARDGETELEPNP